MSTAVDTKPCQCGKRMILELTGVALLSCPPQYPQRWRCYGCGVTEAGPVMVERVADHNRLRWEQANREGQAS